MDATQVGTTQVGTMQAGGAVAAADEYYVPIDPMDDLQCDSCQ
jgi:hypothetical protein